MTIRLPGVTLRSFARQKLFTLINVGGLAVGMACCLMILLYVQYELSYDRFHEHAGQIYRVVTETKNPFDGMSLLNLAPKNIAASLEEEFPEIVRATRVSDDQALIRYEDKSFHEKRIFYVQPEFLEMFTFPLARGNMATALADPYSVVLTRETAGRLFGDEDPMGKVIKYGTVFDLTVTGILEEIPVQSHMPFDYLISFSTRADYWKDDIGGGSAVFSSAGGLSYVLSGKTYLQLRDDCTFQEFSGKFDAWVSEQFGPDAGMKLHVQPMTDIHLYGNAAYELDENSDIRYIYLLSAIALLILLIACFNHMNLSTACSLRHSREVGTRKVFGASRMILARQYLSRSLLLAIFAAVGAVGLVELSLPLFNTLVGRQLTFSLAGNSEMLVALIGIVILVGVVAGSYPAFFLSSFKPVSVLHGSFAQSSRRSILFRNILVVLQYVISITLIICTIIVYQQLRYMQDKDLGFDSTHIVAVPVKEFQLLHKYQIIKARFSRHPNVLDVTGSVSLPTQEGGGAGRCWWEGQAEDGQIDFHFTKVGYNFLDFYNISLAAGRNFSPEFPGDRKRSYILNETAVRSIGWENPIGKKFGLTPDDVGTVIGVVRDYHFSPLDEQIEPLAIMLSPQQAGYISVKIGDDDVPGTLAFLRETWNDLSIFPFEYHFVEDLLAGRYQTEKRLEKIFASGTVLAIFIACLGLFGLASYAAERRTKEIGTRKVFGASVTRIVLMLVNQSTRWVVVANIIAWPVAYYAMNRWLQGFAYRMDIDIGVFVLAGSSAMVIALITVSTRTIKAALANPAQSLRQE